MKTSSFSSLVVLVAYVLASHALGTVAVGAEKQSKRDRVVNFLKNNVLNRTLVMQPINGKLDGGKLDSEFKRSMTFGRLNESKRGFSFDSTYTIEHFVYEIDDLGKRVLPGKKKDRVVVTRTFLREMKSTGKLIGYRVIVVNTYDDVIGLASAITFSFDDDNLIETQSTVNYDDFFASNESHKPGAIESRVVYSVRDNLLRVVETAQEFSVDPDTMKRTKSEKQPTIYVNEEASND